MEVALVGWSVAGGIVESSSALSLIVLVVSFVPQAVIEAVLSLAVLDSVVEVAVVSSCGFN